MGSGDGRGRGGHAPAVSGFLLPIFLLRKGISLVLSRWGAPQVAIAKVWGGSDSSRKLEDLSSAGLSWFSQLKGEDRHLSIYSDSIVQLHFETLIWNILDEEMMLSFNTVIEDGSVEEIKEAINKKYKKKFSFY